MGNVLTANPLKQSPALGAALAFLGLDGAMPMLHGSQGCAAFAKSLLVRHFREAIPLQTSALTEMTVIMGGEETLIQALATVAAKQKPAVIGLASTALTETRGDDIPGALKQFHQLHPEFERLPVVFAATPDWCGSLEEGFARAVTAMVKELVPSSSGPRIDSQLNILPGSHLNAADLTAIKEMVAAFGLRPLVLPDLSGSLDGHTPDTYSALTLGGTSLAEAAAMGRSACTLALGESLRPAAEALRDRSGVPFRILPRLTGLGACDDFAEALMLISGRTPPEPVRRQRRQLQDAMLDCHFYLGGRPAALALEPDLLYATAGLLLEMGMTVQAAVSPVRSSLLAGLPCLTEAGDLETLERLAPGADLLIGSSHLSRAAARLRLPLLRMGIPVWDRLGAQWQPTALYTGTRQLLFAITNLLLSSHEGGANHEGSHRLHDR